MKVFCVSYYNDGVSGRAVRGNKVAAGVVA